MDTNELEGAARDLKGHVKDGYGGLTGDAATQIDGKVDQVAGKAQARFGETIDQVNEAASEAARKAAELARQAGEAIHTTGARAGQVVGRTVQRQPLLSLIGVAAIGYLVSFLVHSPSSPLAPSRPEPRLTRIASRFR
jgi:uncharacterized protein YjbJ (UPF0337 family)